ncbi:carboxypeptidase regulatory-like domain-containing protein [Myxococcus sp. K15C18031901]|uniref:carboxypeptidase regulatory-like domain-containing protein n=1 Tax=Myxococcus dinghuensis TaxID=2906761 RepID=UPI0020A7CF7A|nr:carboxypeptidase regulatory-like domain-containing protein [Myxococcus dinghuensis]MCP3102047.1 carboxypeptidase regulatory-like domain-containing protein [Myxococcus dinghuensis]
MRRPFDLLPVGLSLLLVLGCGSKPASPPTEPTSSDGGGTAGGTTAPALDSGTVSAQVAPEDGGVTATMEVLALDPEGQPLPKAVLYLVPEALRATLERAETDAQGIARLPAPPGRFRLLGYWVRKAEEEVVDNRYQRKREEEFLRYLWRDLEVHAGAPPARQVLRFEAPRAAPLSARLVDPEGKPIAGASIDAVQEFPSVPSDGPFLRNTAYPRESLRVFTDAEGRVNARPVREGVYRLRFDHATGIAEAVATTGAPSQDVSIDLRTPQSVTGRVVDEQGAPVKSFTVGDHRVRDAQGRFTVSPVGFYMLVSAKGFVEQPLSIPHPPPRHLTVPDIVLRKALTVKGRVVLPEGQSVPENSTIAGRARSHREGPFQLGRSGRFSLGPFPIGEDVQVMVRTPTRIVSHRFAADTLAKPVSLPVPAPGRQVTIRVVDAKGQPVEAARVSAENPSDGEGLVTDAQGRATFQLPPGHYTVTVDAQQRLRPREQRIPPRYPPTTLDLPAEGDVPSLEARPVSGPGHLRLLLAQPSHYDSVFVVTGERAWPADTSGFQEALVNPLQEDPEMDVWANKGVPLIHYSAVKEFSDLPPGTYTVFATDPYFENAGALLFREVVQVSAGAHPVVRIRFQGEDARVVPPPGG